jgi:hypothetical protein
MGSTTWLTMRAHVNVGIDHDTAACAVERIRRWWQGAGKQRYPQAERVLITADGGGSNGSRVRWWKWERQRLADETGRSISVCHFPPGTSKWNKVEQRLFAFISQNWRGKPLVSSAVILAPDRGNLHDDWPDGGECPRYPNGPCWHQSDRRGDGDHPPGAECVSRGMERHHLSPCQLNRVGYLLTDP